MVRGIGTKVWLCLMTCYMLQLLWILLKQYSLCQLPDSFDYLGFSYVKGLFHILYGRYHLNYWLAWSWHPSISSLLSNTNLSMPTAMLVLLFQEYVIIALELSKVFTARCYVCTVLAVGLCPCPSVSVTSWCSTKTAECRITQATPHDSPGTLVFWCQRSLRNSTRVTP